MDFSSKMPSAKEIGNRIPRSIDYHVNKDGTMCLRATLLVFQEFYRDSSLKGFITNLLIPFLSGYSYKEKYGEYPHGELPHGSLGIFESYKEIFNTKSGLVILELLKIIVENNYRGHLLCPCGSQIRLRECHGNQIRKIKEYMNREYFLFDLSLCIQVYRDKGEKLPRNFMTTRLKNYLRTVISSNTAQ